MKILQLLAFLPIFTFGQNLQSDGTEPIEFDIMPKQNTYIGLTRVCMKPISSGDFVFKKSMETLLNSRVYTVVESPEQADFYFTFHVVNVVTAQPTTTSTTETRTRKDGSKYTETTYKTEMLERITVDVMMYSRDGIQILASQQSKEVKYSGSSTSSDRALREMNSDRTTKMKTETDALLDRSFSTIEAEYLIDGRTFRPSAISIKSRKMDYSDINRIAELLGAWMTARIYDVNDPGIQEALKKIEEALMEHEPDNKKARIDNEVAAVLYYDKACIFFALKQYKEAYEMIMKSEELDKRIHITQEYLKDYLTTMKERRMFI